MSTAPRPVVLEYSDHRAYLEDWFQWKKSQNARFSHRLFARLAGQRSPSLLLSVIKGERNLTDKTAEAFARAMSLPDAERAVFCMMVKLDRGAPSQGRLVVAAIPASRVEALLQSFQAQLRELCEEFSEESERGVYQIGLHLVPLSAS